MVKNYHIKNVQVVNEGKIFSSDVLFRKRRIERIDPAFDVKFKAEEINGEGLFLIPGIIDDQVHFREPGLIHKATIYTEAKAAVAGGVTSYMEMPNVVPPTLTIELLEEKYAIAQQRSLANYSFYMGTGHHNLDEILKVDKTRVCGIKIFMGSSTGDLLVDDPGVLEKVFCRRNDLLIATHCEDDRLVKQRLAQYQAKYGEDIPWECHAEIRNEEVCINSSRYAIELATKCNGRLHILHITTAEELSLFTNSIPLEQKKITSEVCVHHLWFDKSDYARLGAKIKCNPAIKEARHKQALLEAVCNDTIDVIATDHAPHTLEEKNNKYAKAPAGLPLIQHPLLVMLEFYHQGKISLEKIVEKMCHHPAVCFQVAERGYLREGYYADAVIVDIHKHTRIGDEGTVLYKCGWSPFEGHTFTGSVVGTFVGGHLAYYRGVFDESIKGERLMFNR
ncbi:MAG: dihydroorotase [Chitinophagales bacterium]|nr:dihydroorotase [Chitinophagales bacterium]MDW8418628.1 dihydroorotase [Chitinophagales bacterium]